MTVEFRCQDVGVACNNVARAATPDELVAAVKAHAESKHDVVLNDTLIQYAITRVRSTGDSGRG